MSNAEPTPAVVYGAKSTVDARGSIPAQLADCRELAQREGLDVVAEYTDEAASAYSGDRGAGLAGALAECERLAPCALVVQHSDRLARGDGRQARHLVEIALWARKSGVTIRSVQDDATFGDLVHAVLMGERAHEDSKRKGAAVKAGLGRTVARGEFAGGRTPDGYKPLPRAEGQPRVLVLDPERAAVIRRVIDLGLAGMSSGEAARTANAEGLQAGSRWRDKETRVAELRLTPWTPWRVRQVWALASTFYAGRQVDGATSGNWPALIEPEQAARLAAICAARATESANTTRPGQRRTHHHLLAGLLACSCGSPMHALAANYIRKDGTRKRWYRCASARNGRCSAPAVPAEIIESKFARHLPDLTIDLHSWIVRRAAELDQQRAHLAGAVERERAEVDRLAHLAARVRADYVDQLSAGREDAATVAADALADLRRRSAQAEHRLATQQGILAAAPAEPDPDAVRSLVEALATHVASADTVAAANSRLREAISVIEVEHLAGGLLRLTAFMADAFVVAAAGISPDDAAIAEFTVRPDADPAGVGPGVGEGQDW